MSFVVRRVDNLDREALRQLSDRTRDRLKTGGVVLVSAGPENRVTMVSSVTADLKGRFHAGNIVKALAPLVGGKGGGRPDFAEAGGSIRQELTHSSPRRPASLPDSTAGKSIGTWVHGFRDGP